MPVWGGVDGVLVGVEGGCLECWNVRMEDGSLMGWLCWKCLACERVMGCDAGGVWRLVVVGRV